LRTIKQLSTLSAVMLSIDFPNPAYQEGPGKVEQLLRAIEAIGFDDLAVFDHVVMAHATETRPSRYPADMPILEALTTLAFAAAVTDRIGLSTGVLVLPQRQAALTAKQVATVDTLSGGRMRLGVGVGWQPAEFDALGESFATRGAVTDETIPFLRACWADESIDGTGRRFQADAVAMEPKPPQGGSLPIWVGGTSGAALRRVGALGDGWMANILGAPIDVGAAINEIHGHAEAAGRDPSSIGLQGALPPARSDGDSRRSYAGSDRVMRKATELADLGFGWIGVTATGIFREGDRGVDALIDELGDLHTVLRRAVG
jgi:probable F420-dependent oxidoreductase